MPGIKELQDCGDETIGRDAENIMTAVAGNVELMGDDKEEGLEVYLSGQQPQMIGEYCVRRGRGLFYCCFQCVCVCTDRGGERDRQGEREGWEREGERGGETE